MGTPEEVPGEALRRGLEELNERQREAVRAAIAGGFFERPQASTAEEIAAEIGLSRSTFLYHLRNAERIVFEHALGDTEDE